MHSLSRGPAHPYPLLLLLHIPNPKAWAAQSSSFWPNSAPKEPCVPVQKPPHCSRCSLSYLWQIWVITARGWCRSGKLWDLHRVFRFCPHPCPWDWGPASSKMLHVVLGNASCWWNRIFNDWPCSPVWIKVLQTREWKQGWLVRQRDGASFTLILVLLWRSITRFWILVSHSIWVCSLGLQMFIRFYQLCEPHQY